MKREKGISYCGLACCLCEEQADCGGCRTGGCPSAAGCRNFGCCREQGLDGCWQCPDFPCGSGMFLSVRSRAFIQYIQIHGVEALLDRLAENEAAAVRYHDPGKLTGDYDRCTDESKVIAMLEGKQPLANLCKVLYNKDIDYTGG